MCGIVGWIDSTNDLRDQSSLLKTMTRKLTSRGPNAEGYWLSERAGIGHRRLVVVDPKGGKQPMIREFGGKTYILTYNGELYNTAELRKILEDRGHRFQSYSDTEVVLVAFLEWGMECVTHFNGIFAFGIWNETDRKLFLARDRMGVKPLFYTEQGSSFMFASEIKALLANPGVKAEINREGLAEIFGLGPARTPGNAVFRGICELKPGWWLVYTENGLTLRQYWHLESKPHEDDLATTIEKVRFLVKDAIERQLVSDVPVGAFLSGGLDSSVIAAIAARKYHADGKGPLDTFSLDYHHNDQYFSANDFQPNSDHPWAEQMAKFLRSKQRWVIIDTPQLVQSLSDAVLARDLPGMADIDGSLLLFCRAIKSHVTVALSGECADEVFGGYPWFHWPDRVSATTFPWSVSLEIRKQILLENINRKIRLDDYVNERYLETLREVPKLNGETPVEARRRELFYLNHKWFMTMLLERKDRMSMASGLEVRVPFCDHRLVEYVWNIPWEWKGFDGREKGLLREAMRGILPEGILLRKKSPYPKTCHPDYLKAVTAEIRQMLRHPAAPLRELIDPVKTLELVSDGGINRPWFGQLMAGPQLLAYLIQINIWMRSYNVKIIL